MIETMLRVWYWLAVWFVAAIALGWIAEWAGYVYARMLARPRKPTDITIVGNVFYDLMPDVPKLHHFEEGCTGNSATCLIDECKDCSVRDCPEHEPLHYHHDGCPACSFPLKLETR